MKTYNAYFFVSENAEYRTFLNFVKSSGLKIQTKVSISFSPKEAVSADIIFVDEKTASLHGVALSDIKTKNLYFLPVLLLTSRETEADKSLPACIDDVIFTSFSQTEWKRRIATYLHIREEEIKSLDSEDNEFKTLFTESHSIMFLIDPENGHIEDANLAACRFYGYTHREMTSMRIQQINILKEDQVSQNLTNAGLDKKNHFVSEHRLADGSIKTMEIYSGKVNHKGKPMLYSVVHDITEAKKTERLLRESEEKYRSIFKTSSDLLAITEFISGKYLETNDSFKGILGYTKEDLLGKTSLELKIWVNPDERNKMINTLRKKGFVKDMEAHLRTKGGHIITGLLSAQLITLQENDYIISEIRDITYLKKAEEALKESRQLFETLANNSPTGVFRTDAKGKTTYVNPRWTEITGVSFKKSTSKGWTDILPPNEKEELLERWTNNMASKIFSKEMLRIKRDDGTVRWVLGHAIPEIHNGKFMGYVGTITDITDLVNTEQALRESENKYRSLTETSSDLILTFDINGRLTYLSPVVEKITGYSVDDVLLKNFWEFIAPEYVEPTIKKFKEGISGEYVPLYEIEIMNKSGKRIPVELNVTSLHDADGNTIGRLAVARDITDRKKAENALKESESRLKRFSQITKEGIIIHKNGIIVDANQAILHMLDYSAEELIGQGIIRKLAHPKYYQIIKKNIKKEYVKSYDIEIFKKDGTILPVEVAGINYTDIDGEALRAVVFRDITQRREMEKALRESENKYRSLAEVSIDIILTYNLWGKITYVNPVVKTIFGYSPEELIGKTFSNYIAPEFVKKTLSSFYKGKQGNAIPLYEIEIIHKNGRKIPVEINPTSIYDTEGNIMGGLSIIRDIRVRKKAGKALKESEGKYKEQSRLFRLMSDNIPDLVWAKDLEGRFIFTNKAICMKLLIAKDTDEPIGKRDPYFGDRQRRLYPDRNNWYTFDELCSESDALVYKTQKPVRSYEFGYVQGKFLYFDVYKAPIFDENNQIIGTVGHGRDVTKEKEAEKALLLRDKALNATASAIIITDANGKIEWVNRAFTKLSGYTEKEALGKSTTDLVGTGNQDEAFYENLHSTLKSGRVWTGEFNDKRKDGTMYEVGEVITPVTDKNGKVEHLIGIMNDISERKAAERELRAAKETAEESSRLKSAFLANMNHEIRTPMNAIMGFSDLMLDATPEEKTNYAQIVNKSAGQLLNLIDNIIFLSRLQSEKLPVKETTFYPADLINEIFLMFDLPEMKKNLQLQSQLPEKAGTISIHADAYKIRQVMTNFTSNAIKYTKKGYVKLGFEMHDNSILFFVEDSGMGIPENEQQHILEAFYRGSMAVSAAIRGTGLGLNIAKELVELMGSTISVSSQSGKGSRFYFSLPYEPSKATFTEKTKPKAEPKKWEDTVILIAEDDETNFLYLDVLLREKVCRIDHASNGLEAVEMTRKNTYDLILMDLKMPVMSGAEATLEIKKQYPYLPVIATTAYATMEEKERAMNAGCDDYLGKPIKKTDITALINKYISGKKKN